MIHSVLNLLIKRYILDIDIVELSEKYNIYCKQHGRDVICAIFDRDGSSITSCRDEDETMHNISQFHDILSNVKCIFLGI